MPPELPKLGIGGFEVGGLLLLLVLLLSGPPLVADVLGYGCCPYGGLGACCCGVLVLDSGEMRELKVSVGGAGEVRVCWAGSTVACICMCLSVVFVCMCAARGLVDICICVVHVCIEEGGHAQVAFTYVYVYIYIYIYIHTHTHI